MDAASIAGLVSGITALIGAIAGLIAVIRHVNNPAAHK